MSGSKLGRFVKVMTRGKVITDAIVATRLGKVNNEITAMRADLARLTAAGLTDPTTLAKVVQIETDRDTADNGSPSARYTALGPVKDAARTAAEEVKTAVDAALRDRRSVAELRAQVGELVTQKGGIAADPVERARFATVEVAFDQKVTQLEAVTEASVLKTKLAAASALKDQIAAKASEISGAKLALAAAKTARDTAVATLAHTELWVAWVDGRATPNAARPVMDALKAEQIAADTTPASGRATKYNSVNQRTLQLEGYCSKAYDMVEPIEKIVQAADVIMRNVTPPDVTLAARCAALSTAFRDALLAAAKPEDFETALDAVKAKAKAVQDDAAAAEIAGCDLVRQKADAKDCLLAAKAAVGALVPADPKLAKELADLEKTQTDGLKEADAAKAKAIFLPLARGAADLLARAKTAELKAKAATPAGPAAIDALVAGFGNETGNARDRAICQAAIAARFDMEVVVQPGMKADRLPMFYGLFKKLPAGHMGHAELGRLEYGTKPRARGNYHTPTTPGAGGTKGTIAFNDMPEDDRAYNFVGDDGTTSSATYFEATSLHEAGHGVDAKFKVMKDNKDKAGFGKWSEETLDKAATAYGTRLAAIFAGAGKTPTAPDLIALARAFLDTGACTKPANATAPLGSLFANWDAIVAHDLVKVCKEAREAASPWNSGGGFATRAKGPDNRVFFEAYPGIWFSYDYTERAATGVSTYQWRSPMEWFAEIYALYHTKNRQPPASVAQWVV